MLYLLSQFGDQIPVLNVFRYITFRTGGATVTAIVFVFLFGPTIISALRIRQGRGQPIRDDGPKNHLLTNLGRRWACHRSRHPRIAREESPHNSVGVAGR